MAVPEEIRELPDVTIRVRETGPRFFEASVKPTDPLHLARDGYTLDTKRGLPGRTLTEVLDRAETEMASELPGQPTGPWTRTKVRGDAVLEVTLPNSRALKTVRVTPRANPEINAVELHNARGLTT